MALIERFFKRQLLYRSAYLNRFCIKQVLLYKLASLNECFYRVLLLKDRCFTRVLLFSAPFSRINQLKMWSCWSIKILPWQSGFADVSFVSGAWTCCRCVSCRQQRGDDDETEMPAACRESLASCSNGPSSPSPHLRASSTSSSSPVRSESEALRCRTTQTALNHNSG